MKCAWNELLSILPVWLRKELSKEDSCSLQEIRLRLNKPAELVCDGGSRWTTRQAVRSDLDYCINAASQFSPWTTETFSQGYLTAPGGHRLGICGQAICRNGIHSGFREITSICIRVAKDYPGIAAKAALLSGSILLIGPPGSGKTTLLRDLIRTISDTGRHVCVVDERGELFPGSAFPTGKYTDILTGCPKAQGIEMALRTMSPDYIAVDEITAEVDCEALMKAGWCGVNLLATVHATGVADLRHRPMFRSLSGCGIFSHALVLSRDKSWVMERIMP